MGGKQQNRKDLTDILAAHHLPYVAQASPHNWRDLMTKARKAIEDLVATLTSTHGPARAAVHNELEKAQQHVQTLENRTLEIDQKLAELDAQAIDSADVAGAMEAFEPIWEVLLTPEKERVLRLLIEAVRYDGGTQRLEIDYRLAGLADFAEEVNGAA